MGLLPSEWGCGGRGCESRRLWGKGVRGATKAGKLHLVKWQSCSLVNDPELLHAWDSGGDQARGRAGIWIPGPALAALLGRKDVVALTSRTARAREMSDSSSPVPSAHLCIFHFYISPEGPGLPGLLGSPPVQQPWCQQWLQAPCVTRIYV